MQLINKQWNTHTNELESINNITVLHSIFKFMSFCLHFFLYLFHGVWCVYFRLTLTYGGGISKLMVALLLGRDSNKSCIGTPC